MAQLLDDYVRPELFDEVVDQKRRSYWSTVLGETLSTLRCKTSQHLMPIHQLWIPKYINRFLNNLLLFSIVFVIE
jgi:hypothetical protein